MQLTTPMQSLSQSVSQSVSQSRAAVSTVLQTLPADRHVNTELSGSLAIDFNQLSFFFFVLFVFLCSSFFVDGCKVVRQSRFHLEPAEVELTSGSDRMGTPATWPASTEAGSLWVSTDPCYASVTPTLSPQRSQLCNLILNNLIHHGQVRLVNTLKFLDLGKNNAAETSP